MFGRQSTSISYPQGTWLSLQGSIVFYYHDIPCYIPSVRSHYLQVTSLLYWQGMLLLYAPPLIISKLCPLYISKVRPYNVSEVRSYYISKMHPYYISSAFL